MEVERSSVDVKLKIQGHIFNVDLFVLDMCGSDIVLGAQWLKQLGQILMNYQNLTMKFPIGPDSIELRGDTGSLPTPITYTNYKKLLLGDQAAQFLSLGAFGPYSSQTDHPFPHPNLTHSDPKIQQLLLQFAPIFVEP